MGLVFIGAVHVFFQHSTDGYVKLSTQKRAMKERLSSDADI